MSWPILFILFSFSVFADTELETIEVEAVKDVERFTFDTYSEISTQDLEKEPMQLLAPALAKTPGIVTAESGGPGGKVSFFIRGTESRHISFTLDGLKINDPSNTDRQFDSAFVTSAFIKDVIVHKGPQAVLYGSDALGGMIEMRSRKGENAPETRLSLNGGSFGTIDTSLSKDWKSGTNNNGSLTFSGFHTDGISRLNKKRFNAEERDSTDITQLTSSSEHRWAPKFQTDVLASYLHGKAEQDGFVTDNTHDYNRNDQYLAQQRTNYEIDKSQAVSLRNGFNRHQRHNESLAGNSEFFNGNLFQNEVIHRLEAGNFGLLSGLANEHESAKFIDLDKSFDLNSLFVQGAYKVEKLKVHAGVRADNHTKYGNFTTGSAGLAYAEFYLQYSQGFKAPSLYQLYGPPSFGKPVANPNLVPETSHSLEASWKKKGEIYETGITVFRNSLANQFTYSFTQGYLNQQRYVADGVELSGKLKSRSFETLAGFTHQQFKHEETPILLRPYNLAQLGFSFFPEETLELNFTGRWFSSRKDFGTTGITKLNGYEVVDLAIRKVWERDDVAIQLKNILNREYEERFGFSVIPRSIFLHYGHQF